LYTSRIRSLALFSVLIMFRATFNFIDRRLWILANLAGRVRINDRYGDFKDLMDNV
jgi:hypothetical protein